MHTHVLLSEYTTMVTTHGSGLILILWEYMERYRVGFGRPGRTFVLVHVWIRRCYYLVECTTTRSQLHTHVLFKCTKMPDDNTTAPDWFWLWLWLNAWNRILVASDAQIVAYVGISVFFNSKVYLITLCRMHYYDTIAIAHPCAVKMGYNGDNTRLRVHHGTVSFWHWTNRWYVGMYGWLCLN